LEATQIATALFGDSIATNVFMLGVTYQSSAIPVSAEAIERAIELNGVAVEMNKGAFAWGRLAAHNLTAAEA
jgi:indolepyruvate ferredoxin oxidoreductase